MLFVGLGNIGEPYKGTRHNIGRMIIDTIVDRLSLDLSQNKKFNADLATGVKEHTKFFLLKPSTYVNRSGASVAKIKSYYKIPNNMICVLYDDLEIKFGKAYLRYGGGDRGHNGLKSITSLIGKDYWKISFGIDRPNHDRISEYVLSYFNKIEIESLRYNINIVRDFIIDKFIFQYDQIDKDQRYPIFD